jgi:Proto-chlorophyllide reductase 57 kD subunit
MTMIICACSRWMHTQGIEESAAFACAQDGWLVRFECSGCGRHVGVVASAEEVGGLADRLLWTDEARWRLERMPWYLHALVKDEAEEFVRARGERVVTAARMQHARQGATVRWEPEAEARLERVPAPVRAMARVELERTALERGERAVTVALMDEVKARYFGMFVGDR